MKNGDIFKQFWCFLLGGILLLSISLPETEHLWHLADVSFYALFSNFGFWSIASFTSVKILSLLILGALYIYKRRDAPWTKTLFRCVTVAAFIFATQVILNKLVFLKIIDVKRLNPSLTSVRSFPADHATSLLIATMWLFHDLGKKFGLIALSISSAFILPTLFSGHEGLSDILCGSLAITLLVTPLFYSLPKEELPCPEST